MSNLSRLSVLVALLVSLVGGAVTYTPASAASIRFVKPAGASGGSCTTWATACTLQRAISISLVGDQIWVQVGRYIPHPSDRTVSFKLKNELQIYGGFNGTETQFAQRKPATNVTILSGDIGILNDASDNSYHVVTTSQANSATILDGFIIRGGNANGNLWDDTLGGGMYIQGSSPTLRNLTFSQNSASLGGGMSNRNSSPMLTNVKFLDNSATDHGGGMHNLEASNPTLTNVKFKDNKAMANGGGMSNDRGSATLTDVTFSDNSAINDGGGMNNYLVDSLKLTRVTFDGNSGNSAKNGGGLYNNGGSATLTHVKFLGNTAAENGGGMYNLGSPVLKDVTFSGNSAKAGGGMHNYWDSNLPSNPPSNPVLINATFGGNKAENGGGMFNNQSSPRLTDVTFRGNSAINGGGMYNLEGSNPTLANVTFDMNSTNSPGGAWGSGMFNKNSSPSLTNVTFSGNRAIKPTNSWGGGMFNESSSPSLTNVTFSGNEAAVGGGIYSYKNSDDPINHNSQLTLTNTIIASSLSGGDCIKDANTSLNPTSSNNLIEDRSNACGLKNGENGNITGLDPNLGPLANNGGVTQTHALLAGSPAIDAGTDANCPATDQRRVTRPLGSHCDIGAYELPIFRTISGNAGAAGVTMNYTDGTPKAVISRPNGNYSLTVPWGWSGTVTPDPSCFTFNPLSRTYNNLSTNQTTQNYSAIFDSASGCAKVDVKFGQTLQGTYGVPKNGGARLSFPVDSGPMLVKGTGKNNVGFVASERVVSFNGGNVSTFFELMGLPQNLLSTTYGFPAYDNTNFDSHLLLANVGTSTATVTLKIGKVEGTVCTSTPSRPYPYPILPGTTLRVRCALNEGPLVVGSSGAKIIASLRVFPKSSETSFSELMGLPSGQYDTSYAFPWYDGSTPVPQQLRVANVGSSAATIRILIGGKDRTGDCTSSRPDHKFNIPAGKSLRAVCTGVSGGPVIVKSTGGVDIIASLRAITRDNSTVTAFSEWMGLPSSQFDTGYVFPWYNSKDLDTELRVGNLGNANTKVRIFIGGVEMTDCTSIPPNKPYPYIVAPGKNVRVSCANVNKGPLRVTSSGGVPIVASLSILPRNVGAGVSELMGLPLSQLTTGYAFPSYDNVNLDMQLRFAVP